MAEMTTAYRVAARAVRARWAAQKPEALDVLGRISAHEIAVFSGCYDSVQEVLKRTDTPHKMNPKRLHQDALIAFENCPGDAGRVPRLRAFVERGGWLVSSDWALKTVVQAAFPNTIRWNDRTTADEVVGIEPTLESALAEVLIPGANPQWWLEGASYGIEVLDPERVRVEAASHELLAKYDAPPAAVRFDWEAGHVYHIISHFWLKRSRVPDAQYAGPAEDFMRRGMRLDEDTIAQVFHSARVKPDALNFAEVQSAVTSTELILDLCVQAYHARAARLATSHSEAVA